MAIRKNSKRRIEPIKFVEFAKLFIHN